MHKIEKLSRIVLSVALLFLIWTVNAHAASLYERSLEKFQAGIEHVSPTDFTFVVLGDSRDNDTILKNALALAKTYNPLFILHGGDYSDKGSDKETDHFLALVNDSVPDVPFFVVIGNHENRKVFAKKIGPFNFSLDSDSLKLRVIAVDNASYALKTPELDYLKNQLACKEGKYVCCHAYPAENNAMELAYLQRWGGRA